MGRGVDERGREREREREREKPCVRGSEENVTETIPCADSAKELIAMFGDINRKKEVISVFKGSHKVRLREESGRQVD